MELPKTGIVIPSFQQGWFIERAIVSVLSNAQHCPIKLVVMDGGSTDETCEILERYASQIDYWQSRPDGGQAAAINAGMELLSDCEFVTWLNSDDEYEDEWAVYTMVSAMQSSGAQVAYGRSHLIDQEGSTIGEYPVCPMVTYERLAQDCCMSQPSVFVRKKVWDRAGGLDPELVMCLDYDLWIRLSKEYSFEYVDAVIGNTRIYDATKTSRYQDRNLLEGIYILKRHYGRVPFLWINEKYVRDHFNGNEEHIAQKIWRNVDLRLRFKQIEAAYIREAERVIKA